MKMWMNKISLPLSERKILIILNLKIYGYYVIFMDNTVAGINLSTNANE